jgi:hypothetical protein
MEPTLRSMATVLDELLRRRNYECRLTTDRALATIEDAALFLDDRGLMTRTPDCSLPSLFEACHEEPYRAGGQGFASWPATKWWWAGTLPSQPGVHSLKIHSGKGLFLSDAALRLVDPICRAELTRMMDGDPGWRRLLEYLAEVGPSTLAAVQEDLDLKPKELRALRSPLERCGVLVSTQQVEPAAAPPAGGEGEGGHIHTSILSRYDQLYSDELNPAGTFDDLLVAGVRAAVVAREPELRKWFSWRWLFEDGLADRLVAAGRLARPEPGWVSPGQSQA